ncbi:MAG: ABC transporter permease [Candidatus Desulfatibia sp.]|uniref:ABC transporter permease n=1 Tax=Candidatus Desulfatibia sp. TaxID=3101189 RepID=UPI002F319A55
MDIEGNVSPATEKKEVGAGNQTSNGTSTAATEAVMARFRQQIEITKLQKFIQFFTEKKYYFIGLVAILSTWQILMFVQVLGPDFSPSFSPWAALLAFIEMVTSGDLSRHTWPSLRRVFYGLSLSVVFALPVGVLIGYFTKLEQMTYVTFQFLRMISPLAWMPVSIIIFGVGDNSVVFLLWLVAIWPLILNTAHGTGRVSQLWINMARTMGAGDWAILRKIIIPAAIPDMLTGLRLSVGISWIILVPAEMLGVPDGLGYYILDTRDRFRYDQLMATIVTIGAIGYILDSIMRMFIRRYAWKI